jgi:hypothetical protein
MKRNAFNLMLAAVAVLSIATIGVREAAAAQRFAQVQSCGSYNWCAPSEGGPSNCTTCCQLSAPQYDGGICYDEREENGFQGCLCF